MGNVIKTDEVYKKKSAVYKNKDTGNAYGKIGEGEIVPVRGVYVSGEYRPPYYNNTTVRIENVQCVKPTIVDYTTKEQDIDPPDHLFGLYDVYSEDELDIITYTTKEQDINPPDNLFGLYDVYSEDELDIIQYTSVNKDINPPDNLFGLYDVYSENSLDIIQYKTSEPYKSRGEPILRLMPFECKKAEIENKIL